MAGGAHLRPGACEMINQLVRTIDAIALGLAYAAEFLLVCLITINFFEVIARYVFSSPSIWSVDAAYMVQGSLFLIGLAYTLHTQGHVKIDIFSARLPKRTRALIESIFYFIFFLPVVGLLVKAAAVKTAHAYIVGEKLFSTWQPILWPFYFIVTVGLATLWLQTLAESLRSIKNWRQSA